ncbi:hypothetical protein BDZ45DRAFT_683824 [Acephala macrosclerotiorum]|nr:hypothetical protein BDZ45DRAFT_683824 [Acephala macrosclerotiorum]
MKVNKLHGPNVIHTLARSAMNFEAKVYDVPGEVKSPYVGQPRPELDQAWHDLLQYQNIRISADEMERLGRLEDSIELPGGGYFGSLMVYHQLHCIKRIHHFTYAEHYFVNMTDIEKEHLRMHNAHCLDILRQGIQCQGDATLLTMRWGKHQAIPLGDFRSPHECVNWESLDGWSKERSVDVFVPGVLVHPVHGPSFPGGKVDRIGLTEDE